MRLSFISHGIDTAERRTFRMGQREEALDWSFRKGDTPVEGGSGHRREENLRFSCRGWGCVFNTHLLHRLKPGSSEGSHTQKQTNK